MTRTPAEVFPVGEYIAEEMQARGWLSRDVAARSGYKGREGARFALCVDMHMAVADPRLVLDQWMADGLGKAFGVSPRMWLALYEAYRGRGVEEK